MNFQSFREWVEKRLHFCVQLVQDDLFSQPVAFTWWEWRHENISQFSSAAKWQAPDPTWIGLRSLPQTPTFYLFIVSFARVGRAHQFLKASQCGCLYLLELSHYLHFPWTGTSRSEELNHFHPLHGCFLPNEIHDLFTMNCKVRNMFWTQNKPFV